MSHSVRTLRKEVRYGVAANRNSQEPSRRRGGRGDAGAIPPPLRHVVDLLRELMPVLDQCTDQHGEVDWDAVGAEARLETAAIEASLIEQMAPYDAFDIIGNMLLYNMASDPETYRESEHDGQLVNVEYAAALCLRRPDRRGTSEVRDPQALGRQMEPWNRDIKRLLRLRGLAEMSGLASDPSGLARVRYEQFERELLVRNPAYEWQEEAHLRGLFGAPTVEQDLLRLVGFTIDDALHLASVSMHWIMEALALGANEVIDEVEGFRRLIDTQRSGEPLPAASADQATTIAELAERSDHELDEMMDAFRMWSSWNALGDRSSFTCQELAEVAEVDEEATANFLEVFSQPFGQDLHPDPMRAIQAVKARPIMRDRDRHQCVDGGDLLWAIRDRLEEALKPHDDAWARYDRHRSIWTEQCALDLLAGILQPDEWHHSLSWTVGDKRYELDGLLLLDRYAIPVEVKAGGFTEPARRATPDRLNRDLRKLIVEAHEQARRSRDALTSGTHFLNDNGAHIRIDPARIQTVLPVVITLDELGISPRLWELARSGFLAPGEQHPTTMGLSELEVVCDVLDSPSRLLHYLTRRQTFNQIGGVAAMEEADLVMYYLDQGLYVEGDDHPGVTMLPSLTDPLDEYLLHKHGKRKTAAPKPSTALHPEIETLVEALATVRPGGWTATACFLLDLAGDEQQRLGKRIRTMRKRSRRKHVPHDISIAIDDSTRGLTVVTEPDGDHEQLKEYVRTLSFKNKHMNRASTWSGIGIHATWKGPLQFHLHDATPWEPDEELDEAIAAWTELHDQ